MEAVKRLNSLDDSVFEALGLLKKSDGVSDLSDLIKSVGEFPNPRNIRLWHQLVNLFAEDILWTKSFGGNERSIFTLEVPEIKDRIFQVICNPQTVCTGLRQPGHSGYSYEGEWDGYPPYLEDMKSHRIIDITNDSYELKDDSLSSDFWVRTNSISFR
jgi:hypothetical protein